jgi:hypothetical protein
MFAYQGHIDGVQPIRKQGIQWAEQAPSYNRLRVAAHEKEDWNDNSGQNEYWKEDEVRRLACTS